MASIYYSSGWKNRYGSQGPSEQVIRVYAHVDAALQWPAPHLFPPDPSSHAFVTGYQRGVWCDGLLLSERGRHGKDLATHEVTSVCLEEVEDELARVIPAYQQAMSFLASLI